MKHAIGNLEFLVEEISCIETPRMFEDSNTYNFGISFIGGGKYICSIRAIGSEIRMDSTGPTSKEFRERITKEISDLKLLWKSTAK